MLGSDIVLATLNARFIHSAFGLRYLFANLGPLQSRAAIAEFDISQRPLDIAEALLARQPKIIGLGIYIWNVAPSTELVALLKRLRPEVTIILGGPEVSYETAAQPIVQLADHVLTGEADLAFAEVCRQILGSSPPAAKIIPAPLPHFSQLALPYDFYTDADLAHRMLYVEASRGCPFSCEFCLSSLDIPVRAAPLPPFLDALQRLLDRGANHFKFVDRTFNLNVATSRAILEFLLDRHRPGFLFHFEMVPDRLPESLREVIKKFPPGALQFEVGVQTFNEEVASRIQRRQNYAQLDENLRFLREQTGVHIHSDLILGLPGESLDSLAAGFDQLVALRPHEIQVGLLKRLRGTPISRHTDEWGMVYNPNPPYEILQNKLIPFTTMQELRRFARYWDLLANSGNFVETTPLIWEMIPSGAETIGFRQEGDVRCEAIGFLPESNSPFWSFLRFSRWLYGQAGRTDCIALARLMELVFRYLRDEAGVAPGLAAPVLWRDYQRGGRSDKPSFLVKHLDASEPPQPRPSRPSWKRQARHQTPPPA